MFPLPVHFSELACWTYHIHNSIFRSGRQWLSRICRISCSLHVKQDLQQLLMDNRLLSGCLKWVGASRHNFWPNSFAPILRLGTNTSVRGSTCANRFVVHNKYRWTNTRLKLNLLGPSWWWLYCSLILQLPMQSVPITTKAVSSNHAHCEVYSIQHYLIKFVSDLPQVGGFLRFPSTIKLK